MRGIIITGNHGVTLIDTEEKPQINADRIRAMTDEEMADYFSELSCFPGANRDICKGVANCMDCWLDWLKQEATE